MASDIVVKNTGGHVTSIAGTLWFGGWLFTIGYAKLLWWKALLGLVIWPYYLAVFVR